MNSLEIYLVLSLCYVCYQVLRLIFRYVHKCGVCPSFLHSIHIISYPIVHCIITQLISKNCKLKEVKRN